MTAEAGKQTRVARKTVKAPNAFRTISEVSEDLDLPQHVLRFWETRFTQIRPLKRGGGRRLYRPDHIALLRGIRTLLYDDGLTIRGTQKILREQGAKAVIARGIGEAAPAIAPGEVSKRLAKLKTRTNSAGKIGPNGKQSGPDAPPRMQDSIKRLEDILARLEQN